MFKISDLEQVLIPSSDKPQNKYFQLLFSYFEFMNNQSWSGVTIQGMDNMLRLRAMTRE